MTNLALIGGVASYHGRSFAALINGTAKGKTVSADWPQYEQCVADARIVSVWDEDGAAAQELASTFDIERLSAELNAAAEGVGAVIITDDGSMCHQKHARGFIERGIPTFIDKPLSPAPREAQELAELAALTSTPLMSCSALRCAGETEQWRAGLAALGRIEMAVAAGPGELVYYGIHALELVYSIMGPGIVSVHNTGSAERAVVRLEYSDGRALVLLVGTSLPRQFRLSFTSGGAWQSVVASDDTAFYANMLRAVVSMAQTCQSPVPINETMEIIRVLDAGTALPRLTAKVEAASRRLFQEPGRLFHFQQHQRSKNPRIHSQADLQLQLHPEGCVATVHIPVRTKRGRASTCGDSGPWNL